MHPQQRVVSALFLIGAASTFACGPATVDQITVAATPAEGAVADGVTLVTLVATAKTKDGQPAEGAFIQFFADGPGARFEPNSALGAADKAGTVTVKVSSTIAAKRKVVARWLPADPAVTPVETVVEVTFAPGSAVGPGSSLRVSPNSQVVGGGRRVTGTVTVVDAKGNASPAQSIGITSTESGDVVTPASVTTDDAGRATFTVSATKAGVRTLRATLAGGDVLSAVVTFLADDVDATTSTAVVDGPVTADGLDVATLTATARDAAGNLLVGVPVTFVTPEASGLTARSQLESLTDSDGTAVARLSGSVAGTRRINVRFGDAFVKPVDLVLEPGPVSPSGSSVEQDANVVPADGTTAVSFVVTLRDADGNVVAGRTINASSDVATLSPQPASATTDAAGQATFRLAGTTAASVRVSFAVGSGPTLAAAAVFAPLAPTTGSSSLGAAPSQAIADGVTPVIAQVELKDPNGNPTPGLALRVDTGDATDLVVAPAVSGLDGRARIEIRATRSGVRALRVTVGTDGPTLETSIGFVAGLPSATTSRLELPVTIAGETAAVRVVAKDAQGNAVPSADVVVRFVVAGQQARPNVTGITNSEGVLVVPVESTEPSTLDVIAVVAGTTLSGRLAFVAGAPSDGSSLVLPSAPVAVDAGGARVAIRLRDENGFPVPNHAVRLSTTAAGVTIDPAAVVRSDGLGEATFVIQTTRTQVVSLAFDPDGDSIEPLTGDVRFVSGAVDPEATVAHVPDSPTSDDGAHAITWELFDSYGNPATGVAARVRVDGATQTGVFTSDAGGKVEWTFREVRAGTYALALDLAGVAAGATSITIAPGAPSSETTTLAPVDGSGPLRSDGTSGIVLQGFVKDAAGNPVPGRTVTFGSNVGEATLSPTSAVTDAEGRVQVRLDTALKGEHTIVLRNGRLTLASTVVTAIPGAIDPGHTTITVSAGDRPVVGVAFQLRVLVADVNGNAVSGTALRLDRSRANIITPFGSSVTTDATGGATFNVTSQVAGEGTLSPTEISTSIVAGTKSVVFVAAAPWPTTSSFVSSRTEGIADGTDRIGLTFTARDRYNNLASDATVEFTGPAALLFAQPLRNTDANGVAAGSVVSSLAGIHQVTPRVNGVDFSARTIPLDFGATPPDQPVAGRTLASGCRVVPNGGDLGSWSRPLVVDGANVIQALATCGSSLAWFTSMDGGRTFAQRSPNLAGSQDAVALTSGGRWTSYLAGFQPPTKINVFRLDSRLGTSTLVTALILPDTGSSRGLSIARATNGHLTVAGRLADGRMALYALEETSGAVISAQFIADPNGDPGSIDLVTLPTGGAAAVAGPHVSTGSVVSVWQAGPGQPFSVAPASLLGAAFATDAAADGGILAATRGSVLSLWPVSVAASPFGTPLSFSGLASSEKGRSVAVAPDGAAFVGSATSLGRLFIQRMGPGAVSFSTLDSVEVGNDVAQGLVLAATPSGRHVAYTYTSNTGDVRFGIAGF